MNGRLIDRRNRRRFSVLAVLLIALGVCGLLLRAGLLALREPSSLYAAVTEEVQRQPELAIAALILVGLLLVLVGIHWLREQFAGPASRVRELSLTDGRRGRTTVDADVITRALSRDLSRERGIYDVSARIVEIGPRPRLLVRTSVDGDVDLGRLRDAMESAFERTRQVLGTDGLETHLHIKPVPSGRARVQ